MPASQSISDASAADSMVEAISEPLSPQATDSSLAKSYDALTALVRQTDQYHSFSMQIQRDDDRLRLRYKGINEISESVIGIDSQLMPAIEDVLHRARTASASQRDLVVHDGVKHLFSIRTANHQTGYVIEFNRHRGAKSSLILDQCNLTSTQLKEFRQWLRKNSGLVIITANNNSALETLSLAVTQELCSVDKTVTRIADEITAPMPRILQCNSADRDNVSSMLQLHNDAIVVDRVNSALIEYPRMPVTSTLLVQTTKSNSPGAALANMLSDGYSSHALAYNTIGVLICHSYQQLCESCKCIAELQSDERDWLNQFRTPVSENVLAWLDDGAVHQYLHSEGCDACHHSGIAGIGAVYELVQLNDDEREALARGESMSVVRQLDQKYGSASVLLNEARKGLVSLSEIRNRLSMVTQNL